MGFEIITKLRKEKGLTLEQLSKESVVPLGTLKKIVTGVTKDPQLDTLKAISRVLGCTLDDFDEDSNIDSKIIDYNMELLEKWSQLTDDNKIKIMGMIEIKLADQQ